MPTMSSMPIMERRASFVACALVLLVPFIIFVKHHDYSLLSAETWLAGGVVGAIGLVLGILLAVLPAAPRVLIAASSFVLFVDLQMDWIESEGQAALLLVGSAVPLWFVRARLGRGFSFVAAVMIATTIPLAPGDGFLREEVLDTGAPPSRALPPIIHLVLDEHIAADAIPMEFDPNGALAGKIIRTYVDLGFQVYTRAFSRHFTTAPSLSHLVNLSSGAESLEFYAPTTKALRANAYFSEMSKRGYRIDVLQTDYVNFCSSDDGANVERCVTYTLESPKAIEGTAIGTLPKARTIAGMYFQRSSLFKEWRKRYKAMARRSRAAGLDLPAWPLRAGRMSTVSSMALLPMLQSELASVQPGTLYFAHLLLPHYPYAFDRHCAMRPSPVEWLTYKDAALRPTRNNSESRAERYALYLEQLECTTSRIGGILQEVLATEALRDAIVIVHGDHGSRINVTTPNQANLHRMHDVDFTDAFATHFAVRMPSAKAGVDTRSIAIDELLSAVVRQGAIPDGTDWIASPDVVITGQGDAKTLRRPMVWPADH
jgi:hypothetical protein